MKLKNDLYDQALETISTLKPDDAKVEETKLEQAHKTESLWDAFSIIKSVMGDEPYKSAIRQTFDARQTVDVPYLYNMIWDLSFVYGALTLNIDGFTARGHRNSRQREDAPEFSGKDVGDYVHLIGARRTFIANLHGKTDSVSSWVFTREEISALISNPSYRTFIQTIFSTMTVVFVGISADDSAAGGLLAQLKDTGVDPGPHYWITDRSDAKTGAWASASGINVIRYTTVDDEHGRPDHTSPLSEIFLSLKNARVRETKQDPVLSPVNAITTIPSVAELKMKDEDEVRVILASYAKGIIKSSQNTSDNDAYKEFIKKYSPFIYQSWHITSDEPYNKFFGFEVLEEIASSPFSSVWKVKDESGTIVTTHGVA